MNYLLDLHTHTLASGHAYNTIKEMVRAASLAGLHMLGITEHAPKMPGTCQLYYFQNFKVLPRTMEGVQLLFGAELNILDADGHVDLPEETLANLDITVASLHIPCITPGSIKENTRAVLNAIRNPYINIIGHPDDGRYPLDYEAIVLEAKKYHTLLEINNSSLNPQGFRKNTRENDLEMLKLCKSYGVPVIVSSDAHFAGDVGRFPFCQGRIKGSGFPGKSCGQPPQGAFICHTGPKEEPLRVLQILTAIGHDEKIGKEVFFMKKGIKRWICFLTALVMAAALTACSGGNSSNDTGAAGSGAGSTMWRSTVKDYGAITWSWMGMWRRSLWRISLTLAGDGFYDGLTFHRIISGFMIQGGDPTGTGMGGSDETIKGEFSENGVENSLSHTRGVISMARSQDMTAPAPSFLLFSRIAPIWTASMQPLALLQTAWILWTRSVQIHLWRITTGQ